MKRGTNPRRGTLRRLALALAGLAVIVASSRPAEAARWRRGGGVRRYGFGRAVVRPRYRAGSGGYRVYRPAFSNRGIYGVGTYGAPVAPLLPYSYGVYPPVM